MAETVVAARGLVRRFEQPDAPPQEVLRGVDLNLAAGEFVAILGPSGSGKSTLMNILGLMDRPSEGSLAIFGREASALPELERSSLRSKKIGFVFQFDSLLPEFTLLENTAMPGRILGQDAAVCQARARELLEAFGLGALAGRYPRQTSGGERQRAAVARALHNRPALVLADEPTGNLDRENGELVFNDLRRLAKDFGVTVVVVTHNEHSAALCDRAFHLSDGRLAGG